MRLNNWSIAASYDTDRIFAGLGFGSSIASRSIISRPRRTGLCSGSTQVEGLCSGSIGISSGASCAVGRVSHAVLLFGRNPPIHHCRVS
jgi:hypothetical protein